MTFFSTRVLLPNTAEEASPRSSEPECEILLFTMDSSGQIGHEMNESASILINLE